MRLTFPAQQEVHAKDRNPQADLSARGPAALPVLLLARLTLRELLLRRSEDTGRHSEIRPV